MKIIEDLINKIQLTISRIEYAQNQLKKHQEGVIKLSYMLEASIESSIEKNRFLLKKYQKKLRQIEQLKAEEVDELEEFEKEKDIIRTKNYFKYQKIRIKRDQTKTQKQIASALNILEELPEDIQLKDKHVYIIADKSSEQFLDIHTNLDDELLEIKSEFLDLINMSFDETNAELRLLNYRIPIIVLQLRILLKNIQENLDESNLDTNEFKGLPNFEDWWIKELWTSHQAYMALFRWKDVVLRMCITTEQKKSFEMIFKNWILVKKILSVKGKPAYIYNNAFDDLIYKYTGLKDEYNKNNLVAMQDIIEKITLKENFNSVSEHHNVITPYMQFKLEKKFEAENPEKTKKGKK